MEKTFSFFEPHDLYSRDELNVAIIESGDFLIRNKLLDFTTALWGSGPQSGWRIEDSTVFCFTDTAKHKIFVAACELVKT